MKHTILTFSLFCFSLFAEAQTTLEFNQALLLQSPANTPNCNTCWTVPAGKVWKLTDYSTNSGTLMQLYVNGKQLGYFIAEAFSNSSSNYWDANFHIMRFPIWLPSGTTIGYTGMSNSANFMFFGIEFNVNP